MMNPTKVEDAFYETFERHRGRQVPPEWQQELCNYIVRGLPPGGFHTAVFANDLMSAAAKSHVSNTWPAITAMCMWLMNVAPRQSWGSYENVDAWLKLTKEERTKILIQHRLLYTEQEVAWNILKEPV